MADNLSAHAPFDAQSEGLDARRRGQRREACPHPQGSQQRQDWLEGFDGGPEEKAPDLPLDGRGG